MKSNSNIFNNSILRDRDYARKVLPLLNDGFLKKDMPIDIESRCHICGDSKTNKNKKRLGIYETTDNTIHVHCFKCGYTSGFSFYLKEYWPSLFKQYVFDVFEENGIKRNKQYYSTQNVTSSDNNNKVNNRNINEKLVNYCSLDRLPETHPIFRYVKHRMIPKECWSRIGFTSKWKELANEVRPNTFETIYKEHPRLVVPSFDKRGNLTVLNGRAFTDDQIRYQIIKVNDHVTKIFGEDRVNLNKPQINIVEGPIDSFFIDNSIALAGASLNLKEFDYPKSSRVFILDNESRHPDTIRRMQKFISAGEKVVIWDKLPVQYRSCKDINDMVTSGFSVKQINEYIKHNVVSGLNAQLRFDKWKKG